MKRTSTLFFTLALCLGTLSTPLAIMAQDSIKEVQEQAVPAPPAAPAVEVQSGQAVVAPAEGSKISEGEFLQAFAQAFMDVVQVIKKEGSSKIAIVLGLILVFSQLLIRFTNTSWFGNIFAKASDSIKQVIVAICTVFTTAIPMYMGGASIGATLASGAVMTALSFAFFAIAKTWFPSLLEKLGLKA